MSRVIEIVLTVFVSSFSIGALAQLPPTQKVFTVSYFSGSPLFVGGKPLTDAKGKQVYCEDSGNDLISLKDDKGKQQKFEDWAIDEKHPDVRMVALHPRYAATGCDVKIVDGPTELKGKVVKVGALNRRSDNTVAFALSTKNEGSPAACARATVTKGRFNSKHITLEFTGMCKGKKWYPDPKPAASTDDAKDLAVPGD